MALPGPKFGAGPLKDGVLSPEGRDRNILTFKEQMNLISDHFDGDEIGGITFLTNERSVDREEVKERIQAYRDQLSNIEVESCDGIDPMVDRAFTGKDIDEKIENMILTLLDALSHIISRVPERQIVFLIQGTKTLMMVETFVGRLTKNIPNLSFVHHDYTSGRPSNLKNLNASIFSSVRDSDGQVKYVQPKDKNSKFHESMVEDIKMNSLMRDDYNQGIGLGEASSPNEAGFDSPTRQGAHSTKGGLKERRILDNEGNYTPHGIIVRAVHAGRPEGRPEAEMLGKFGVVMPIGVERFDQEDPEGFEEKIKKKATKFLEQINTIGRIEYVQPIFIHTHDNGMTGTCTISQLPEDFDVLKSNMEGIQAEICKGIREIRGGPQCQVFDPYVMLIGTDSIENLSAGLLHILSCLKEEDEDGLTINWRIFASTWVGASAIVAADAMITMQIPSIAPFRDSVGGLIPETTAIQCTRELLVELRRIELLLSLKDNSLSKGRMFSCILAAAKIQALRDSEDESCLKGRFKEGDIRTRFQHDGVTLPNHWDGVKKKIDGDLRNDLKRFGWVEFLDQNNARLLREGKIIGHVLTLYAAEGG